MRPGHLIAGAALAAEAPRLALVFLAADNLAAPPGWRAAGLTFSAVSQALVLTGGAAYIMHRLADAPVALRRVLAVAWFLVLALSAGILAPLLAAGLAGETLSGVLETRWAWWAWSAASVVALYLAAGAAVLADTAGVSRERAEAAADEQLIDLAKQLAAAEARAIAAERELDRMSESLGSPHAIAAPIAHAKRKRSVRAIGTVPCRNGCDDVGPFASPQAEAAHQRWCPRRVIDREEAA